MAHPRLEAQAEAVPQLRGMPCSQVSVGAEETLILDFGELHQMPDGQMAGDYALAIDCPWRIDSPETGVIGWEDPEEEIVDLARVLIDSAMTEYEIRRPGLDLILTFSNDHSLRIFPDCRAYFYEELAGDRLPWQLAGSRIPV